MNKTNWSIAVVLAIVVTGCATPEQHRAQQQATERHIRAMYTNDCVRAGYAQGTEAHERCLYAAAVRADEANRAQAAAIYLQMQGQKPATNPYYQDPNMFKPKQTTCNSVPDGLGGWRTVCQ